MYRLFALILILIFPLQLWAENKKPQVIATNYPLAYFAERISGELIDVNLLVPEGIDPADWKPKAEDIVKMQQADLVLLNGAGYESWLESVSLSEDKLIDTSDQFEDELIKTHSHHVKHSHGKGEEHEHEQAVYATSTWLDMSQAVKHADIVRVSLLRLVANSSAELRENFTELKQDLEKIDARLKAIDGSNEVIIASHPVYQYLARAYGLKLRSLHWEPGEMPSAKQWDKFDTLAKKSAANKMIWEDEPVAGIKSELESRDKSYIVFKTCSNKPEQGDFLTVMQENAESLAKGLS